MAIPVGLTAQPTPAKQLSIFVLLTLAISWSYEAYIIANGGVKNFGLIGLIVLMWIPGLVSVVYRKISGLGFSDVGWRRGKGRHHFFAILFPLILAFITSVVATPLGLRGFSPLGLGAIQERLPLILISLILGFVGALGEEIGWRGFLLPKLFEAKVRRPYLVSGLIWAIWHLPLVAFGGYYSLNEPLFIAVVYTLSICAIGTVIGISRMRTGSVWLATTFHAAHNFFFQLFVPFLIFSEIGPNAKWWELIGADCGLIVAILYFILAFVFLRNRISGKLAFQ